MNIASWASKYVKDLNTLDEWRGTQQTFDFPQMSLECDEKDTYCKENQVGCEEEAVSRSEWC